MSRRESAADYAHLVVALSATARVVVSSCGIQWVLQHRGRDGDKWRSAMFFRSNEGLLMFARPLCAEPEALETLDSLPEWFPGGYPWWPGKLGETAPPAWPQAEDEEGWPTPSGAKLGRPTTPVVKAGVL